MEELRQACTPLTEKKAEAAVKSGTYQQYYIEQQMVKSGDSSQQGHVDQKAERREERRRKAATGKGGGGTQGRETKTKAVKKHARSGKHVNHDSDSEDGSNVTKKSTATLEIITIDDIKSIIKRTLENEGLDGLLPQVAGFLYGLVLVIAIQFNKK